MLYYNLWPPYSYKFFHMSRQHSCGDMWKNLEWSFYENLDDGKIKIQTNLEYQQKYAPESSNRYLPARSLISLNSGKQVNIWPLFSVADLFAVAMLWWFP